MIYALPIEFVVRSCASIAPRIKLNWSAKNQEQFFCASGQGETLAANYFAAIVLNKIKHLEIFILKNSKSVILNSLPKSTNYCIKNSKSTNGNFSAFKQSYLNFDETPSYANE